MKPMFAARRKPRTVLRNDEAQEESADTTMSEAGSGKSRPLKLECIC